MFPAGNWEAETPALGIEERQDHHGGFGYRRFGISGETRKDADESARAGCLVLGESLGFASHDSGSRPRTQGVICRRETCFSEVVTFLFSLISVEHEQYCDLGSPTISQKAI
jgi:hypothetical protein